MIYTLLQPAVESDDLVVEVVVRQVLSTGGFKRDAGS